MRLGQRIAKHLTVNQAFKTKDLSQWEKDKHTNRNMGNRYKWIVKISTNFTPLKVFKNNKIQEMQIEMRIYFLLMILVNVKMIDTT